MHTKHIPTTTPHPVFYMGTAATSFRPGERGQVHGLISLEQDDGQLTIHLHVIYEDGFEFLAPYQDTDSYLLLGPRERRIESMNATFSRIDSYKEKRKQ